jgi:hypothetical protein
MVGLNHPKALMGMKGLYLHLLNSLFMVLKMSAEKGLSQWARM